MAFLADRVDGTSQGTIDYHWYNDAKYLLTGQMTDQPVTIYYAPSPGANPAVLTLQTNGNTHGLHIQNSTGTQLFDVDATGNVTFDNELIWMRTLGGSNQNILNIDPTDGGTTNYILIYNHANNHLFIWNGNTSTNLFDLDTAGNLVVNSISADTFAGGVPLVADKITQHVTSTGSTTILTYTPPTTGTYRVSAYLWNGNTTSEMLTLTATYKDPDSGSTATATFYSVSGLELNGTVSIAHGAALQISPLFFRASSTANIVVAYQDPGGAPGDYVTISVEQLA